MSNLHMLTNDELISMVRKWEERLEEAEERYLKKMHAHQMDRDRIRQLEADLAEALNTIEALENRYESINNTSGNSGNSDSDS